MPLQWCLRHLVALNKIHLGRVYKLRGQLVKQSSMYYKNLSDNENVNLKMPCFLWQGNLPNRASKIKCLLLPIMSFTCPALVKCKVTPLHYALIARCMNIICFIIIKIRFAQMFSTMDEKHVIRQPKALIFMIMKNYVHRNYEKLHINTQWDAKV